MGHQSSRAARDRPVGRRFARRGHDPLVRGVPATIDARGERATPSNVSSTRVPEVAIVGRPNVGKSTLFNRLLNEVLVPIQGLPLAEGIARGWDLYTGSQRPYESVDDILGRMLEFTATARARHAGREVVAVTHGDPIGFLMLWARGRPVTAGNKGPLYQHYLAVGSITTLTFATASAEERPTLEYAVPYTGPANPI